MNDTSHTEPVGSETEMHPTRAKILGLIRYHRRGLTTTQIRASLTGRVGPMQIHRHLTALAQAGLVEVHRPQRAGVGQTNTYRATGGAR